LVRDSFRRAHKDALRPPILLFATKKTILLMWHNKNVSRSTFRKIVGEEKN
jgi:hypothetical protein